MTADIIFLTSSTEFALESYEVKAKGYLLKPVSYEKLWELLEECGRDFQADPEISCSKDQIRLSEESFIGISNILKHRIRRSFFICRMEKRLQRQKHLVPLKIS